MYWKLPDGDTQLAVLGRDIKYISRSLSHLLYSQSRSSIKSFYQASIVSLQPLTISYIIRATLTRPTSIAATSSCDQKISLVESVDISSMILPKACAAEEEVLRKEAAEQEAEEEEFLSRFPVSDR
jgi:hypothetical protein